MHTIVQKSLMYTNHQMLIAFPSSLLWSQGSQKKKSRVRVVRATHLHHHHHNNHNNSNKKPPLCPGGSFPLKQGSLRISAAGPSRRRRAQTTLRILESCKAPALGERPSSFLSTFILYFLLIFFHYFLFFFSQKTSKEENHL